MDDPVKVIHKYKNNNGRVQYHVNIFIGDLLDSKTKNILDKIKPLTLLQTFMALTSTEIEKITSEYGPFWYEYFFTRAHIHKTMLQITQTKARFDELEKKYGKEWMGKHIKVFDKRVTEMNISYEFKYEEDQYHKDSKRILRQKRQDLEEIPDFTIHHIIGDQSRPYRIVGGEEAPDANLAIQYERSFEEEPVDADDEIARAFSELDKPDEHLAMTTKEIKSAITSKVYEKDSKVVEFDQSNDNNMFDQNIADVFHKEYIRQYIYKDDTIKTIQNKICCGFLNNPKFPDPFIIPAYQHMWSEYLYNDRWHQVMIGKKITTKNNILPINVEPHSNIAVYEDLRYNLKTLSNYIKRHNRVKIDNDLDAILYDYCDFMTYNELFMCDIFNDLGLDYNPTAEELKNVVDVYVRIYYPHAFDNIKDILKQLKSPKPDPIRRQLFETLNNSLVMENEVMRDVEYIRKYEKSKYDKYFQTNHVTQSFIRTYVVDNYIKLRLYRIFNNFILTEQYPFIQYMSSDNIPRFNYLAPYLKSQDQKQVMMKWFETTPYGISFKIKIITNGRENWLSVNITDIGRVDYKIHWKEDDALTIDDVDGTYKYIQELIRKINYENEDYGIVLRVPKASDFRFAFINTIQKIQLPDNFYINHNDLSDFAVYFYPYISVVIEPRKRKSIGQKDDKSKFGTYLLYKRISRFDNRTRIEQRIIYYIRHYEQNDDALAKEISKEFNLSEKQASDEIEAVRTKYPTLKKSRTVLKRLEEASKYKPPGIRVNIQGKTTDKYKLKIDGARSKHQLERINEFMKILMYLYVDTYLYKKPERQKLRDKLKKLTNIARRQKKVEVYEEDLVPKVASIKQITKIDTKRFAKSTGDRELWATQCQNSGNDKRRRPQWYFTPEELELKGYKWVETLDGQPFGHYQKIVKVGKKEVKLRAIKLALDDTGENHIYYTCDPEENGRHMFVGFLSKTNDNTGAPPTCCFLRDHLYSRNEDKRLFFIKNIGMINPETDVNTISGDQLYILQHGSKVQEGRFAFLSKYLDIMFNFILGYSRTIKNHYLVKAPEGAFFRYGTDKTSYRYLNAIGAMVDMTVEQLKVMAITKLKKDKDMRIFTSLKQGDIRNRFKTTDAYIDFWQTNEILDYPYVVDLLCIPGVAHPRGLNIVMFKRKIKVTREVLEKEKTHEMYFIECRGNELDLSMPTLFIIKDGRYFYPIAMITKKSATSKTVNITKLFEYEDKPKNIVRHINEFYIASCKSEYDLLIKEENRGLTAREIIKLVPGIKGHIIDQKYRSKYVITKDDYLIPTRSSGTDPSLEIYSSVDPFLHSYDETMKFIKRMTKINLKPIGLTYTDPKKIVSIITESGNIPIKPSTVSDSDLTRYSRSNIDDVDKQIAENNPVYDKRVYEVNEYRYRTELYQLFRYHLSYILNYTDMGKKAREKLIDNTNPISIKRILYRLTSGKLLKKFDELVSRVGIKGGDILPSADVDTTPTVMIIPSDVDVPDDEIDNPVVPTIAKPVVEMGRSRDFSKVKYNLSGTDWISTELHDIDMAQYKVKNNRTLCFQYSKDECPIDPNCTFDKVCKLAVTEPMLIDFINKVVGELVQQGINAYEILMIDDYFVSDIVDYDVYMERPNERVITTSNSNLNKILNDIFGKEGIPTVGKRRNKRYHNGIDISQWPLRRLGKWYYQTIIPENNSVYRAFANSYYWLMHPFSNLTNRNLGYYSKTQTHLANIYKSQVIDWLRENGKTIKDLLKKHKIYQLSDYILTISERISTDSGIIPLYVLSIIYETMIYIYDQNQSLVYLIHPTKGIQTSDIETNYIKKIYIRFTYPSTNASKPNIIESMYPHES